MQLAVQGVFEGGLGFAAFTYFIYYFVMFLYNVVVEQVVGTLKTF